MASAQEVAKSSSSAEGQASAQSARGEASTQEVATSSSGSAEVPKTDKKSEVANHGLGLTWESF